MIRENRLAQLTLVLHPGKLLAPILGSQGSRFNRLYASETAGLDRKDNLFDQMV